MTLMITLATLLLLPTTSDSPPPADVSIEWVDEGAQTGEPLEGEEGSTAEVRYRVRNVGGRDAYAVLVQSHTALGPLGPAIRLRPGPKAGQGIDRTLTVPLARGMRELCVEGRLQTLDASRPAEDPSPRNNRACRPIRVVDRLSNFHQDCLGGVAP
ncbi:MAG: hypothetical protein K8J08_10365 [Thermoanaerobaculia bacterium]|nr:hypothetical protein [Thermoanaerobaculia bacterium]